MMMSMPCLPRVDILEPEPELRNNNKKNSILLHSKVLWHYFFLLVNIALCVDSSWAYNNNYNMEKRQFFLLSIFFSLTITQQRRLRWLFRYKVNRDSRSQYSFIDVPLVLIKFSSTLSISKFFSREIFAINHDRIPTTILQMKTWNEEIEGNEWNVCLLCELNSFSLQLCKSKHFQSSQAKRIEERISRRLPKISIYISKCM